MLPDCQELRLNQQSGVLHITLNRPQKRNAMNGRLVEEMMAVFTAIERDRSVRAVVLRGAEGNFCAGGDIRALYESGQSDGAYARDFYYKEYQLNHLIKTYGKPYIALIDGVTMGGGVGVSVHGSHRVAGDRTLFAMPETGIGLFFKRDY